MKNTYSLRAESIVEANLLEKQILKASQSSEVFITPDASGLPDQEIEISTILDFNVVLGMVRSIPDGHVMLQTLRAVPLTENSLLRDYDRQ